MVTPSTIQTNRLRRSAHSSVLTRMASRISVPPMVGVPAFCRWLWGPSSRTVWPIWRWVSRRIRAGPSSSEIASAVSAPRMARRVR